MPYVSSELTSNVGLQHVNLAKVPSPKEALGQVKDEIPYFGKFNYISIVGILMCIVNNTRPDIAFAMSQSTSHTH
eukprot:7762801-Ditylum_brightwellii.AAC.1